MTIIINPQDRFIKAYDDCKDIKSYTCYIDKCNKYIGKGYKLYYRFSYKEYLDDKISCLEKYTNMLNQCIKLNDPKNIKTIGYYTQLDNGDFYMECVTLERIFKSKYLDWIYVLMGK